MVGTLDVINKSLFEFRDDMDTARKAAVFETRLNSVEFNQDRNNEIFWDKID